MNIPRCPHCGERHSLNELCAPGGRRHKVLKKEIKMKDKQAVARQLPEAIKLFWKDGRISMLAGRSFAGNDLVEKIQPMYLAQGVSMVSYHDATEQLAFAMYGCTINQLDDKEAERVRHFARVTVNAAIGVQQ